MTLKFKCRSKHEVPAEHLSLYTECDGAWLRNPKGAVEKARLDKIRTCNVAPLKARDELKQRFDGIDPDAARALALEKQKLEEAAQLKAGEITNVVEVRVEVLSRP